MAVRSRAIPSIFASTGPVVLFTLFAVILPGGFALAQPPGVNVPVPRRLAYTLTVERIGSGPLMEFSQLQVRYSLSVFEIGVTGPAPGARRVRICAKVPRPETTCTTIAAAEAGRRYTGSVSVFSSYAGLASPIRLVVLGAPEQGEDYGGVPLEEGETFAEVYARYTVDITGFEVVTSRSNRTDTQWLVLQGMVKSDPPHPSDTEDACRLAGFTWCLPPHHLGSYGDGRHTFLAGNVGPYDLTPEKEADLRFLFYLDNIGDRHQEEIAAAVADGFSKVGLVILSGYSASQGNSGGSSFATQLDGIMSQMHSSATASCDGRLAADVVILTNRTIANRPDLTLESLTRPTGLYEATLPNLTDTYREKDGDFICDRRGSNYRVSYRINRTSWVPWAGAVEW